MRASRRSTRTIPSSSRSAPTAPIGCRSPRPCRCSTSTIRMPWHISSLAIPSAMSTVPPSSSPTRPPMLTLAQALDRLIGAVRPLADTETVSTFDALGRVLAEDVTSSLDVPPADNTAMDGYALRCADVPQAGTVLPVSQRIPAGVPPAPLQPGTAARIFTGAQVPAGADAIVMQEQCVAIDGGVRIDTVPGDGQWIRCRGEDVRRGATVLSRGERLTPQAMGLAASVGAATLRVARRPRVAL